jgi:hypothetical protein
MRLRQIGIKHNCVDAGFTLPANMVDLVSISRPGKSEPIIVKMTQVAQEDVHRITLKRDKVVDENAQLRPRTNSLLSHRWLSTISRGNRRDSKLSSSKSMSSLEQSQEFVVLGRSYQHHKMHLGGAMKGRRVAQVLQEVLCIPY